MRTTSTSACARAESGSLKSLPTTPSLIMRWHDKQASLTPSARTPADMAHPSMPFERRADPLRAALSDPGGGGGGVARALARAWPCHAVGMLERRAVTAAMAGNVAFIR